MEGSTEQIGLENCYALFMTFSQGSGLWLLRAEAQPQIICIVRLFSIPILLHIADVSKLPHYFTALYSIRIYRFIAGKFCYSSRRSLWCLTAALRMQGYLRLRGPRVDKESIVEANGGWESWDLGADDLGNE